MVKINDFKFSSDLGYLNVWGVSGTVLEILRSGK